MVNSKQSQPNAAYIIACSIYKLGLRVIQIQTLYIIHTKYTYLGVDRLRWAASAIEGIDVLKTVLAESRALVCGVSRMARDGRACQWQVGGSGRHMRQGLGATRVAMG